MPLGILAVIVFLFPWKDRSKRTFLNITSFAFQPLSRVVYISDRRKNDLQPFISGVFHSNSGLSFNYAYNFSFTTGCFNYPAFFTLNPPIAFSAKRSCRHKDSCDYYDNKNAFVNFHNPPHLSLLLKQTKIMFSCFR